jgi:hypothetical protein
LRTSLPCFKPCSTDTSTRENSMVNTCMHFSTPHIPARELEWGVLVTRGSRAGHQSSEASSAGTFVDAAQ